MTKKKRGRGGGVRVPGFRYDGEHRTAYLDVRAPGSRGRQRFRKVVHDVSRDEALGKWKRLRDEARAGRVRAADLTLRAYFEAHWKTMRLSLSPKGAAAVGQAMRARVLPHVGDLPMRRINLAVVRDLTGALRAEEYAPASINGALGTLRKILKDAVAREVLDVYPIKGRLPRQKEEILRLEMTDEEWLAAHAFYVTKDWRLDERYHHCEPSFMAKEGGLT